MEISTKSLSQTLNLYSVFGYLLPGFFLSTLPLMDYDFSSIIRCYSQKQSFTLQDYKSLDLKVHYVLDFFSTGTMSDFKFIPFLIYIFFCYLLGHLVSAFSSFLIERLIVKKFLGFPSYVLLSNHELKYKFLFGNYRRPFKLEMRKFIAEIVEQVFDHKVDKEDYYWLCYSYIITARPYLSSRVHHFVNLYGFSRNVTASIIIYLLLRSTLLTSLGSSMDTFSWITWLLLFISASLMFWNYLKLFKRQAIDVYYLFISIYKNQTGNIETKIED